MTAAMSRQAHSFNDQIRKHIEVTTVLRSSHCAAHPQRASSRTSRSIATLGARIIDGVSRCIPTSMTPQVLHVERRPTASGTHSEIRDPTHQRDPRRDRRVGQQPRSLLSVPTRIAWNTAVFSSRWTTRPAPKQGEPTPEPPRESPGLANWCTAAARSSRHQSTENQATSNS